MPRTRESEAARQRDRYRNNPEVARKQALARQERRRRRLGISPRVVYNSHDEKLEAQRDRYVPGSRSDYYLIQKDLVRERRLQPEIRCRDLLQGSKQRAKERGLQFDLTLDWILERWTGCCELTGLPFRLDVIKRDLYSPSIDRINSTQGYTQSNCRLVLWAINMFKSNGSDDDIYTIAQALMAQRTGAPRARVSSDPLP